ncbi:MAG: FAD:protein FMN transferase [Methanoregulaceae archaeon]|nr:FAD:protein FMN transferase [Methanoregulaceae archaeon]
MGVDARIIAYAPDEVTAEKACAAAFARIAELDTIMSDYRKDSELNRLCARAGGPPVQVSPDLLIVFIRAQDVSRLTGGAFDITAAPVIQLWRTARRTAQLPTKAEIEAARRLVGYRNLTLDKPSRFVRLRLPGMKLDLGGIAKGYACDEAQKVLRAHGVKSALVEMGGDIVVSDAPPGALGWKIMVSGLPFSGLPLSASDRLAGRGLGGGEIRTFSNCAVSTSGDTEQFVIIGGKRYSHVVDPRTGWAVTNRVQATVVAKDGLTSDPVSKIFALTGTRTARRVLRHYWVTESYVRVARD